MDRSERHEQPADLFVIVGVSALSGALWGVMAWLLLDSPPVDRVALALMASPVIGVAVGLLAARHPRLRWWQRALFALGSLYVGAGLFGLALGVSFAGEAPASHWGSSSVVAPVGVMLWGLTVTGWCLWLWPLSYLNHHLIWRLREPPPRALAESQPGALGLR